MWAHLLNAGPLGGGPKVGLRPLTSQGIFHYQDIPPACGRLRQGKQVLTGPRLSALPAHLRWPFLYILSSQKSVLKKKKKSILLVFRLFSEIVFFQVTVALV